MTYSKLKSYAWWLCRLEQFFIQLKSLVDADCEYVNSTYFTVFFPGIGSSQLMMQLAFRNFDSKQLIT